MHAVYVGKNGFRLLSLPEPMEYGVIGLIGANGLGKTVSLLLLAGKLEPSIAWKALIKMYEGKFLESYLKGLESCDVRTCYKPQRAELLHHMSEAHKSLCDLKIDKTYIEEFCLSEVLNKAPEGLNANESQRIAIAAALSKDADYYFIDQPTDHLDVFERVLAAKLIKKHGSGKSVVVADHDLSFLESCCDKAQIFYGTEDKEGFVSSPYSCSKGVSAFVGGYLPKEKKSIRDVSVTPKRKIVRFQLVSIKKGECLLSWTELSKDFGNFIGRCDSGEVCSGERLALVGKNELGKSGILKIIAGLDKPGKGEVRGTAKTFFKPQHIPDKLIYKSPQGIALLLGLGSSLKKPFSDDMRQRIALANCFAQQADIYFLDQPTSGLDAERRVVLAKMLLDKTAVIADHDLWFLKKVCNRWLLFDGEPGMRGDAKMVDDEEVAKSFSCL
jgi:ATP-binding cassette subfamily E protein 1